MSLLKQTLLDTYGGFADKRIKKIETGKTFIADDRGPGDYGADKEGGESSYVDMMRRAPPIQER